jgi:Holliday junction resolvase-like predicted endonuclease
MNPAIRKCSNHKKIAGDYGESLVLYWLSKYGFESAKVDHTGIDLIANNPHTKEVMGISVKSRTRLDGKETESVTIYADDFEKIDVACEAFHCKPYFAIVVDAKDLIKVFIISKPDFLKLFPTKATSNWKMSKPYLERYAINKEIMSFEFQVKWGNWWLPPK